MDAGELEAIIARKRQEQAQNDDDTEDHGFVDVGVNEEVADAIGVIMEVVGVIGS